MIANIRKLGAMITAALGRIEPVPKIKAQHVLPEFRYGRPVGSDQCRYAVAEYVDGTGGAILINFYWYNVGSDSWSVRQHGTAIARGAGDPWLKEQDFQLAMQRIRTRLNSNSIRR